MALKNSSRIVYKGMDHVDIALRYGDDGTGDIRESYGNKEMYYAMRVAIPNEDKSPNVIWERILDESEDFDHFVIPALASYWSGSQSNWYAEYLFYPKLKKFEKINRTRNGEFNRPLENSGEYYNLTGWSGQYGDGNFLSTLNGFDFYRPKENFDLRSYDSMAFPLKDGVLYISDSSSYWGYYNKRFCYIPIIEKNYDTGEIKFGDIEYYDEYYDEYIKYFDIGSPAFSMAGNYVFRLSYEYKQDLGQSIYYICAFSKGPYIKKINIGGQVSTWSWNYSYDGKAIFIIARSFLLSRYNSDYKYIYQKITIDSELNVTKENIMTLFVYGSVQRAVENVAMLNGIFYYDINSVVNGVSYRYWKGVKTNYLIIPCCNKDLKPVRIFFNYKYENVENKDDYKENLYFNPNTSSNYNSPAYFSKGKISVNKPGFLMSVSTTNHEQIDIAYIPIEDLLGNGTNNSYYFRGFIHHQNDFKNIYTQIKETENVNDV